MGYYARTTEVYFIVKADKVEPAFEAYKEWERLFPEQWATNFYTKLDTLQEVFEELGFNADDYDGGLIITNFDAKWREQDKALDVFKDFVDADSYISFIGEDGEQWRWTPEGVKNAVISWV